MSFQPILVGDGLPGWQFLQRTLARQTDAQAKSPSQQRDAEYFIQNIGRVQSASALVEDRRLLRVALGAFGLDADINSRFFIEKVLESKTGDNTGLAARLTDNRYRDMARAFGFGDRPGGNTTTPNFADGILTRFQRQQFENSVGESSNTLRLALNAQRSLTELASAQSTDTTKWLRVLGNPPLRQVFETALGLPPTFGKLDVDRQLSEVQDKAKRQLGIKSISDLADPALQEKLIQRFLLRAQVQEIGTATGAALALQLLQR
jgi:hypothetical protein